VERSKMVPDGDARPASWTHELPASIGSARVARQLVRSTLGGFPEPVVEVAELLVSELVANAVRHAGSAPIVRIEVASAGIRVAVQDASATIPQVQLPSEEARGGRGLVLVDSLAASWGWSKTAEGKRVWFTL
jgi:anti-sigma regulatory factor (Ser/Thr protein kinase)